MNDKRNTTKFTIQFNSSALSHLKAIKILNSVAPRGKAQLIADALILYNQTFGLADVSNTDDVVISETPRKPKKESTKKKTSDQMFDDEINSIALENEFFDDEDDDFDDDELQEPMDENALSSISSSLSMLGVEIPKDDEEDD